MTAEEDSNQTSESSGGEPSGPVCGERLAEARRSRGISILEIAKELHLDEPKVRALEENSFEILGAPVFAKGHMRKYAELVGVSIDDVLADYYQLNRSTGAPPVVGPPRKMPRDISIVPWAVGVIVILVIAAAAWWWLSLERAAEPAVDQPSTLAPFESEQPAVQPEAEPDTVPVETEAEGAIEETESGTVEDNLPDAAPSETTAEQLADVIPAEEAADGPNEPAANTVELELSFGGDCWTEVTDATGRRLFFELGAAGRTVTLSGVEPLGVLLGDSTDISIRVNGFDYNIPAANRRGNTARLTIYGQ